MFGDFVKKNNKISNCIEHYPEYALLYVGGHNDAFAGKNKFCFHFSFCGIKLLIVAYRRLREETIEIPLLLPLLIIDD